MHRSLEFLKVGGQRKYQDIASGHRTAAGQVKDEDQRQLQMLPARHSPSPRSPGFLLVT